MSDAPESTTEQKAARSVKRGSTLARILHQKERQNLFNPL